MDSSTPKSAMEMSKSSSAAASGSRSNKPNQHVPIAVPEENTLDPQEVQAFIDQLKNQVASGRTVYIKKRIEENALKVDDAARNIYNPSKQRRTQQNTSIEGSVNLLFKQIKDSIDLQNGIKTSNENEESDSIQKDGYAPSVNLLGPSIPVKNAVCPIKPPKVQKLPPKLPKVKNAVCPIKLSKVKVQKLAHTIKLPKVQKLPPYTAWMYLDRNQRMTKDQSVVGRRRIYYDNNDGEALICSDSEEDALEEEEEEIEFAESEDYILRMVVQKFGLSDMVLNMLANCFSKKLGDLKARYGYLTKDENDIDGAVISSLDKDLDAALNSFNNLFCCRCLIFNCRLHGNSQELIFPAEKQSPSCPPEAVDELCGRDCYRLVFNEDGSTIGKSSAVNEAKEVESWKPLAKSLYKKGLEIFGKRSCLIARNTMCCQKTCAEVFKYMNSFSQGGDGPKADADGPH